MLPPEVAARVARRPRLLAHLTLVHEAAEALLKGFRARWPELQLDEEAVLFGAATHDVGKLLVPAELSAPGSEHELRGRELLREWGYPDRLNRFAETHGGCSDATLEDLLVRLADKIWKGARDPALEDEVCGRLGPEKWAAFMELDDLLTHLAEGAPARLEWQAQHPVDQPTTLSD